MRHQRALWVAALVLCGVAIFAAVAIWRASRALRSSSLELDRESRFEFTVAPLDGPLPAGFDSLPSPASFHGAAIFGERVFAAGGGGLYEYDTAGTLLHTFRTGLELPAAPVVAVAAAVAGVGSAPPELWMATAGEGAIAYDGSHLRHIRPVKAAARKLTAVLPLTTGRILFGTAESGVLVFDGATISQFHPSLADAHVTALAGDEANLWVGTRDSGVLHLHAGQLDRFGEAQGLPESRVFSIAVADGAAYVATALGIGEIREEQVRRTLAQGFTVESVLISGNAVYAGTLEDGLLRIPLEARTRPTAVSVDGCPNCTVRQLLAGSAGGELLALTPDSLFRMRGESGRGMLEPVLKADAARLADRNIAAVAPDGAGHLWIGYFDRGMDVLDLAATQAQHIEDDVLFCVNRIVHGRDRTAVATSNGLALFSPSGAKQQVLTRSDGLIASQVTDVLFRADGSLVAGTPAGVSFIEGGRISSIYAFHGLVNNHVYALAQIGSRTLAGTLGGLSVIESGITTASYTTANSGFKHNWITAILPAGNDIYAGTYGGGILHAPASGGWAPFADLPPAFEVNPNAMAASSAAVYAGTLDRGLAVYQPSQGRWHWVTRGLPSLNVTAVAVRDGTVYAGTDNGLVRVSEENILQ